MLKFKRFTQSPMAKPGPSKRIDAVPMIKAAATQTNEKPRGAAFGPDPDNLDALAGTKSRPMERTRACGMAWRKVIPGL